MDKAHLLHNQFLVFGVCPLASSTAKVLKKTSTRVRPKEPGRNPKIALMLASYKTTNTCQHFQKNTLSLMKAILSG